MEDAKKYEVLGAEGESIEINGVVHAAGDVVELTASDAEAPLAAGSIKLVEEAGSGASAEGETE